MKTIIWDVDDVLNDLMKEWFMDYSLSHATCSHTYDRLTDNPPHALLGISREEYLESLDTFRLSGKVEKMRPVGEVFEWFCRNGDRFHHVALTATPLCAGSISAGWVMRHFGRWIRSFNVIPSPRTGEKVFCYHETKADFLRWWGKGDILVDDSTENVTGALALGLKAVLFPRPWNGSTLTMEGALAKLGESPRE
ncbi:MAG: hypothetical protein AAGU11_05625 [Syntrophobacteraceae bacterium]